ncbi:MAG: glycosyltransferase family 39 protein [Patescibacteria group bacterium]
MLILILAIASILRLIWLGEIPNAIGGDELTYILTAKSIFLTGHDITGLWSPLSAFIFRYPPNTLPQAELPYFLLTPIIGLANFSLLSAKVTYACLSILIVLFIYLISKRLFNKEVGIIAAGISAINPWFIFIGRTVYESTPATLFYLIAIYILLITKKWKILLAMPFFLLGFYSYIATKLIFLPIILTTVLYAYFAVNKKQFAKQYLLLFLFSLIFVGFFVFAFKLNPGPSRLSEILTPDNSDIAKEVDLVRKNSIQNSLTNVLENKYTIFARIISTKLMKSFSFDYLFTNGDEMFPLGRHGLFYILDALFLLFGFAVCFAKQKKVFLFLSGLAVIGTIPHLFHSANVSNFSTHLALMFPFLIIFIALGIWQTINLFKFKIVAISLISFFYLLLVLNFSNIYFFQFPLLGHFDFQFRVLSNYVYKAQNQNIIVYSSKSGDIFRKYIFYNNLLNKNTKNQITAIFKNGNYGFGKVKFVSCNIFDPKKTTDLIIYDTQCGNGPDASHLTIPRLADGGESFQIYNDTLCKGVGLNRYPQNLSISDFEMESLSRENFCQTFITAL